MSTDELLKHCRYYHGENKRPTGLPHGTIGFWNDEASAVAAAKRIESGEEREDMYLSDYSAFGKPGSKTNVPPIILAFLFNSFCKGGDSHPLDLVSSFESLLLPRYMASTSI